MNDPTKIPMSSPDITDREREIVAKVLDTPNLSMGPFTLEFERLAAERVGARHAIAVNSGTAGLHLCVLAAGVKAGDLVITTPFSFVASANAILFERGIPIFVDVDPRTGNMAPEALQATLRDLNRGRSNRLPRSGALEATEMRAVLSVDVFGQPADMDPICAAAREFGLTVIEDSCEAIGAGYKGRPAGMLGDTGVFAFYPNKQMTTGEGGLIVTDDHHAAERMRALRNQGRMPGDSWLRHSLLGYNYRIDELSAALGAVQLARLDELLEKRERVAGWYAERLAAIPGVELPFVSLSTTRMSWFVYVVRVSGDRDAVAKKLEERGIPSRPYFAPIHLQPYMVERFGYREGDFPVAEELGRKSLALPFSSVMEEAQVEAVCGVLSEVMRTKQNIL